MKLVYQTDFTETTGDCVPACIATAFGMKLENVPHVLKDHGNDWLEHLQSWMSADLGYILAFFAPRAAMHYMPHLRNIPYFILGEVGESMYHMCMGLNGQIIHDPNSGGSGIKEVKDYAFLLPCELAGAAIEAVFDKGRYLNKKVDGICTQEDCRILTNNRIYEHHLHAQRRHFLCEKCLEKFGLLDGEVVAEKWPR